MLFFTIDVSYDLYSCVKLLYLVPVKILPHNALYGIPYIAYDQFSEMCELCVQTSTQNHSVHLALELLFRHIVKTRCIKKLKSLCGG